MAFRMAYAFIVKEVGGTTVFVRGGAAAVAGQPTFPSIPGTAPRQDFATRYYSQDAASAAAKSWNRQFQSSGIDCSAEVYGAPIGEAVPNSVYTLSGEELDAKLYERTDTIARGLRQRIADANRVSGANNGGGYDDDKFPDLETT